MKKILSTTKGFLLVTLLTILLATGTFAAIVRQDTTGLVSKKEVMDWSKAFAETLRTLDHSMNARFQEWAEYGLETRAESSTVQSSN